VADTSPYANLGEWLADMTGHDIYPISLVIVGAPKYGLAYDPDTDELSGYGSSVTLGAQTRPEILKEIAEDHKGGVLSIGPDTDVFIDALKLSVAVHQLLYPGRPVPSDSYHGRGVGFRADVMAIRAFFEDARQN
jgi:hypothetical protein